MALHNFNSYAVILFIIVGFVSGIYHGIFNNDIYHNSANHKNLHEKIHTIWIHIICGVAGATCLYPLYRKFISYYSPRFTINTGEIVLLIIGLILISGLGPMILWFFVLSVSKLQDAFIKLIGKMLK